MKVEKPWPKYTIARSVKQCFEAKYCVDPPIRQSLPRCEDEPCGRQTPAVFQRVRSLKAKGRMHLGMEVRIRASNRNYSRNLTFSEGRLARLELEGVLDSRHCMPVRNSADDEGHGTCIARSWLCRPI